MSHKSEDSFFVLNEEENSVEKSIKAFFDWLSKTHLSKCSPFLEDIDVNSLALYDYYDIINEPMSIMKISSQKKYRNTFFDFVKNFRQIFLNCYIYNGTNHSVSHKARDLEKIFQLQLLQLDENIQQTCSIAKTSDGIFKLEENFDEKTLATRSKEKTLFEFIQVLEEVVCDKKLDFGKRQIYKQLSLSYTSNLESTKNFRIVETSHLSLEIEIFFFGIQELLDFDVVPYKFKLGLVSPKMSLYLNKLMTFLLSTDYEKRNIKNRSPMTYEIWTNRLKSCVGKWFQIAKEKNSFLKVENVSVEFFRHFKWVNPFEGDLSACDTFTMCNVISKMVLIKSLCESVSARRRYVDQFHSNKADQFRATYLGKDESSDLYKYMVFDTELCIFKHSRIEEVNEDAPKPADVHDHKDLSCFQNNLSPIKQPALTEIKQDTVKIEAENKPEVEIIAENNLTVDESRKHKLLDNSTDSAIEPVQRRKSSRISKRICYKNVGKVYPKTSKIIKRKNIRSKKSEKVNDEPFGDCEYEVVCKNFLGITSLVSDLKLRYNLCEKNQINKNLLNQLANLISAIQNLKKNLSFNEEEYITKKDQHRFEVRKEFDSFLLKRVEGTFGVNLWNTEMKNKKMEEAFLSDIEQSTQAIGRLQRLSENNLIPEVRSKRIRRPPKKYVDEFVNINQVETPEDLSEISSSDEDFVEVEYVSEDLLPAAYEELKQVFVDNIPDLKRFLLRYDSLEGSNLYLSTENGRSTRQKGKKEITILRKIISFAEKSNKLVGPSLIPLLRSDQSKVKKTVSDSLEEFEDVLKVEDEKRRKKVEENNKILPTF